MATTLAKTIFTNTMLLKSDWDSIDNKYLINSVRKSTAYTIFTDIILNKEGANLRQHQQELFSYVAQYMNTTTKLRIIYSTPTGSGKTFSSMLLQKLILKRKRPTPLLIYSVPTKEILKRVGSDCEAHGINYWTAGKIGTDYFIRRPYSVRTSKDNAGHQRGDMYSQLLLTIAQSIRFKDKIPGRCDVILADIEATAALLEVFSQSDEVLNEIKLNSFGTIDEVLKPSYKLILDEINSPDTRQKYTAWLRPENSILFFDEPNMGIHISPDVFSIVQRIVNHYPHIAILASATMNNWDELPEWWKGHTHVTPKLHSHPGGGVEGGLECNVDGSECIYHTISSMAFNLPIAELGLISQSTTHTLSTFDLFNSHDEFITYIEQINDISMGQLFRHFTKKQIEYLINTVCSGSQAQVLMISNNDDMRLPIIRQTQLQDILKNISADTFNNCRNIWSNYKGCAQSTLSDNVSKTGITLVASYDPYKTAKQLLQFNNEQEWNDAIHTVRKIIKHAQTKQKTQEREQINAEKLSKKRSKDEDADVVNTEMPPIKCKFGKLELYVDELDGITQESLVFLSKGIAISAPDADPGIKLQFQRAIYSKPEDMQNNTYILPEIHILVVDYSSIYGLDCPGVDKIILCDDLGNLLNPDDIIQFIGRLRRAGNATFMSFDNIVKILGNKLSPPTIPSELLRYDIITGLSTLTDKEQVLQLFKKLCKRVYNGTVFEQENIFKTIIYTIIYDIPEQEIKRHIMLLTGLAETFTIPNMTEFLTSITTQLIQFQVVTLKFIFTFLYNYVNDTDEEYNLWYGKLQEYDADSNNSNVTLMQKMTPIIDWINSE